MSAQLFRVILPVNDIHRAAEFYGLVLGEVGMRVSDGRHYFNCEGTILACLDAAADGDDVRFSPNPEILYFAVDDLEDVFRRCEQAKAQLSTENVHGDPAGSIHRRPWGERSFYVFDPFGNQLCFVDRATKFTGS